MTTRELIAELAGIVCRCGKPKGARWTFCAACYSQLPWPQQKALYQGVGQGYEEAYEAAVKTLEGSHVQ